MNFLPWLWILNFYSYFIPSLMYRYHLRHQFRHRFGNLYSLSDQIGEGDESHAVISSLFTKDTKIHKDWESQLKKINRPSAVPLLSQLTKDNVLAYNHGLKTPVSKYLNFILTAKEKHPDKILLSRVGEFYETVGLDAVLLVQYAGLNPMGNKAKAGCPIGNIQQTLDSLTEQGLSVAVYEEADTDSGSNSKTTKSRYLSQIISPASRLYTYNMCTSTRDIDFLPSLPILSVCLTAAGYSIAEIFLDQRTIRRSERMTEDALRVVLETGFMSPIYVSCSKTILPNFMAKYEMVIETGYQSNFHDIILSKVCKDLEYPTDHFHDVQRSSGDIIPLYKATALQVGLMENENVPPLLPHLLLKSSPAVCKRFLRRWLLSPPSYELADHFRQLCHELSVLQIGLPIATPIDIGKAVTLITKKQANVAMFRDIASNTKAVLDMIQNKELLPLQSPLVALTASESGISVDISKLVQRGAAILSSISNTVADEAVKDLISTDVYNHIPEEFFARNEEEFRNRLNLNLLEVQQVYAEVQRKAAYLCQVVQEDVSEDSNAQRDVVSYDTNNNILVIKKKLVTSGGASSHLEYVTATDRFGKSIPGKHTTRRLAEAVEEYKRVCEEAQSLTRNILQSLSAALEKDLDIIAQTATWTIVLKTAYSHTSAARQRGWVLPTMLDFPVSDGTARPSLSVRGMAPYWLGGGDGKVARNDMDLAGIFLLTAPNMAGKSTLLRSTLVVALLANCGMFVPCTRASVPRYRSFFLRTASYDIPSEGMSAFALEMDDVRVMLRDSADGRGLVMLDEIGKGTSSKDGASIAGALLETLDSQSTTGIFCTHLHEMLDLPLNLRSVSRKTMSFSVDPNTDAPIWNFTLKDGECRDSMALVTARHYGLPDTLIARASNLAENFELLYRTGAKEREAVEDAVGSEPKSSDAGTRAVTDLNAQENLLKTLSRLTDQSVVVVRENMVPPPSLEGQACTYVLLLRNDPKSKGVRQVYVGETESVGQRLLQHRTGNVFDVDTAFVTRAADKSDARRREAVLINALKSIGYEVLRSSDGSHRLFSNNCNTENSATL